MFGVTQNGFRGSLISPPTLLVCVELAGQLSSGGYLTQPGLNIPPPLSLLFSDISFLYDVSEDHKAARKKVIHMCTYAIYKYRDTVHHGVQATTVYTLS